MSKSILGYAVVVLLAVSGIASAMKPSTDVAETLSAVKSGKASVEARNSCSTKSNFNSDSPLFLVGYFFSTLY